MNERTADPSDDATDAEMRVYDVRGDGIVRLERDGEKEQLVVVINCDEDRRIENADGEIENEDGGIENADGHINRSLGEVLGLGSEGDTYYEFSPDNVSHVVARSADGIEENAVAKRLVGREREPTDDRDGSDVSSAVTKDSSAGESAADRIRRTAADTLDNLKPSNAKVEPVDGHADEANRGLDVTTDLRGGVVISHGRKKVRVGSDGIAVRHEERAENEETQNGVRGRT